MKFFLNPFMPVAHKMPSHFDYNFVIRAFFSEIFEGEMQFRSILTILLQLFCEFIVFFKVTFISMIGPDNTRQ